MVEGKDAPESTELGVRKLAKMAVRNDFFRDLAFHPGMMEIATTLLGPDVYLFPKYVVTETASHRRRENVASGQCLLSANAERRVRILGCL